MEIAQFLNGVITACGNHFLTDYLASLGDVAAVAHLWAYFAFSVAERWRAVEGFFSRFAWRLAARAKAMLQTCLHLPWAIKALEDLTSWCESCCMQKLR